MKNFTAIIERDPDCDCYVALCPEVDVASQGTTVSEAKENLREALDLFFECASPKEVKERTRGDVYVTQVEVACA
jgi:predicted RNase H-like HicB family nuclease